MPECRSMSQRPLDQLGKGILAAGGSMCQRAGYLCEKEVNKVIKWESVLEWGWKQCGKGAGLICQCIYHDACTCLGLALKRNPFPKKTMRFLCFDWPKPWCCSTAWEQHPSSERHQQSQVAISAFVVREKMVSERKRKWSASDKKTMCQKQPL